MAYSKIIFKIFQDYHFMVRSSHNASLPSGVVISSSVIVMIYYSVMKAQLAAHILKIQAL